MAGIEILSLTRHDEGLDPVLGSASEFCNFAWRSTGHEHQMKAPPPWWGRTQVGGIRRPITPTMTPFWADGYHLVMASAAKQSQSGVTEIASLRSP